MGQWRKSKKPNWNRCVFCGQPVLTRRIKGANKVITLSPDVQYILIADADSADGEYYYNGRMVKGRKVLDGLAAYSRHKCRFVKK